MLNYTREGISKIQNMTNSIEQKTWRKRGKKSLDEKEFKR
jgi:hypothetical protein